MKTPAPRAIALGFGFCVLATAMLAWSPIAEAQYFWSPWFQAQPRTAAKPRKPAAPRAPSDDLPPIVPKESSAPPPPDDRPYDPKLLRLAEILGAVHYLRELCGAQEGQLWRDQMTNIVKYEGSTAVRRAKLVNSFNDGYRGYRRTYRTCNSSATVAITRFSTEGAQITSTLAKPSHLANRGPAIEAVAPAPAGEAPADANKAEVKPEEAPTGSTSEAEATGEPAEPKPAEAAKPRQVERTEPRINR
ncbi:MAG: TIGR02301 family protein [Methyloceanibacter sp.]